MASPLFPTNMNWAAGKPFSEVVCFWGHTDERSLLTKIRQAYLEQAIAAEMLFMMKSNQLKQPLHA